MKLTTKQIRQIIKEELTEMYAPETDLWAPLKKNVNEKIDQLIDSVLHNRFVPWIAKQLKLAAKGTGSPIDPHLAASLNALEANREFLHRYYTTSIQHTAKPLGIYKSGGSDWATSPGAKEAVYQTVANHPKWKELKNQIQDMIDFGIKILKNWSPTTSGQQIAVAGPDMFLAAYELYLSSDEEDLYDSFGFLTVYLQ
jgi:hypothetical protein